MEHLSIGVSDCLLKNKISNSVLRKNIEYFDDINYINISAENSNEYEKLKSKISEIIAEHIVENYEHSFLNKILNTNYCYFNNNEKKIILKKALGLIMSENDVFNSIFKRKCKAIVNNSIKEYLKNTNEIILDGFINFRLKDYRFELEDIVEKAVDKFLLEKEYNEFIRILKYFVDIQQPKYNLMHIVALVDNKYLLYDQTKVDVTQECINDFIKELPGGDLNYDDLLISVLITAAPKKVIFHSSDNIKNAELINTVRKVFFNKIEFCKG